MSLNKNLFDAALHPGIRALIASSNQYLRQTESVTFNSLLDSSGQFLEGVSFLRNCPLCNKSHYEGSLEISAHGMQLLRCPQCQLIYSREVINKKIELERYVASSTSDANLALKINSAYATLEQKKSNYVIARLVEYAGNKGRLLDIGSSTGSLLLAAEANGWGACGIEINVEAVNISKKNGLSVICDEFPCQFPEDWRDFNAVSLFDVLEHIVEPLDFLAELSMHVPPGGWLMIQVPNYRSLLLTIEGAKNNNICHGHWSYFEEETLLKLMQKAGYEVKFFETYITELDRVFMHSDQDISSAWFTLTGECLTQPRNLTVDQLHEYLLGYKLFGLFQKVSSV
ncbi:class I SAM-dependent methyltransferase [Deefgea piscis]|uniref:class I SAM-dependent methyltransferase n=1 Tax=Deefgea piscis TaxID=2739061 RepID=UPI001C7F640A|nr:class I SAM-dependent methyltransferase [Deefgea piscis]QZA80033.1 class I SAM-dependent methyltransferase [Deefgea piscis]